MSCWPGYGSNAPHPPIVTRRFQLRPTGDLCPAPMARTLLEPLPPLLIKRTFLPAPVREYQIRRVRFPSASWRLRFELTAMGANNETRSVTIFPPATTDTSTSGWLLLDLR